MTKNLNLKFYIFVFAILRTYSSITREIYVETTNEAHNFNLLIELVFMMNSSLWKKIKVKTEGPIVFAFYALFSILLWRSNYIALLCENLYTERLAYYDEYAYCLYIV